MVLVMIFIILFSVFTVVNTDSFYSEQYVKNGADRDTGVSFEDLDKITAMLLDYLNDKRDDLDMQVFGRFKETGKRVKTATFARRRSLGDVRGRIGGAGRRTRRATRLRRLRSAS